MEIRYEVFISSTFVDLAEERAKVMRAVLALDCFPAGMELFPAANATQWNLIERAIDRCDYYVVVVAGRYGSLGEGNLSYTEKEYDYAVSRRIPVLAFVHGDPDSIPVGKTDKDDEARKRLEAFRAKVSTRERSTWLTADELATNVTLALVRAFKTDPRPGWVRGPMVAERQTESGPSSIDVQALLASITSDGPPPNVGKNQFWIDTGRTATPTFAPLPGNYSRAQRVTISSATPGATIYVTDDGSLPTPRSPVYSEPINIAVSKTISALAIKEGRAQSGVATATYVIEEP